ncbi:MAG: NF038122 family metalloprotease [Phycisphaerae bacterium]|nr:NF038122 family metalloprotease [Phycisphaerae bacterium]
MGTPKAQAMNIIITPDAGLSQNAPALTAFDRAANAWSSVFTNNITINISAGLSNSFSNPSIIGNTSAVKFRSTYDFFRNKIVASAANEPDDGIVASLPDAAHFNATLPAGFTFSGGFIATKANFKALGYVGLDGIYGANDATITFNSNFAFDYDNSNGVDSNKIDFQSVAEHEIGHALGFLSEVDTIDYDKHNNISGSVDIMPLDLFRFKDNVAGADPATPTDFTNDPRFLDTGGSAIFDDLTAERAMSTGVYTGDGLEASHWKDDAITGHLLGVMDPTMNFGVAESISYNDIRALDLIGYDFVPEPNALILLAIYAPLVRRPARHPLRITR